MAVTHSARSLSVVTRREIRTRGAGTVGVKAHTAKSGGTDRRVHYYEDELALLFLFLVVVGFGLHFNGASFELNHAMRPRILCTHISVRHT